MSLHNNKSPESIPEPEPQTIPINVREMADRNENREIDKNKFSELRVLAGVAGKAAAYAVPRAGKLYAKAALGATAGLVGVAAGIATSDDMKRPFLWWYWSWQLVWQLEQQEPT